MPVREMPWTDRFDGAVLYDTMHHFDEELETLEVIRRTLVPGGQIYIHEGVRPPAGSEAEKNLVEEMERFGTLESPFDPDYLVEVVERAGFTNVRRLVEVDELVDLVRPQRRRDQLLEKFLPDRLRGPGRGAGRPAARVQHHPRGQPGSRRRRERAVLGAHRGRRRLDGVRIRPAHPDLEDHERRQVLLAGRALVPVPEGVGHDRPLHRGTAGRTGGRAQPGQSLALALAGRVGDRRADGACRPGRSRPDDHRRPRARVDLLVRRGRARNRSCCRFPSPSARPTAPRRRPSSSPSDAPRTRRGNARSGARARSRGTGRRARAERASPLGSPRAGG